MFTQKIMHTKILLRTLTFNSRYQQWIEKDKNIHLEMLRGSYANEVFGLGSDDLLYEHSSAFSRITWSPNVLCIEDLDFMMDYFMRVMLKNNYYINLSDERHEIFDAGLKLTIHRHYLKPEMSLNANQNEPACLYGNIFIEHRFNSAHNTFCISAQYGPNTYLSFEKLMEILLE